MPPSTGLRRSRCQRHLPEAAQTKLLPPFPPENFLPVRHRRKSPAPPPPGRRRGRRPPAAGGPRTAPPAVSVSTRERAGARAEAPRKPRGSGSPGEAFQGSNPAVWGAQIVPSPNFWGNPRSVQIWKRGGEGAGWQTPRDQVLGALRFLSLLALSVEWGVSIDSTQQK